MKSEPRRWLESELPARLQRALQSAAEDGGDTGRLERRLAMTLGAEWGAWPSDLGSGVDVLPHSSRPPSSIQPPAGVRHSGEVVVFGQSAGSGIKGAIVLALSVTLGVAGVYTAVRHAGIEQRPRAQDAVAKGAGAPDRRSMPASDDAVAPSKPAAQPASERLPARGKRAKPAPEPSLSEEVAQLDAIREHLRDAPALALQAASAHERRFPRGALAQERELLRIEALFRLGRNDEALARADQLEQAPGGASYRVQVRRLIARYAATAP